MRKGQTRLDGFNERIIAHLREIYGVEVSPDLTELDLATGHRPQGSVHDYSARLLGGICGVAGAFGTTTDIAAFAGHITAPTITAPYTTFGRPWITASLRSHVQGVAPSGGTDIRGLFWLSASGGDPEGVWY